MTAKRATRIPGMYKASKLRSGPALAEVRNRAWIEFTEPKPMVYDAFGKWLKASRSINETR